MLYIFKQKLQHHTKYIYIDRNTLYHLIMKYILESFDITDDTMHMPFIFVTSCITIVEFLIKLFLPA